MNEFPRLSEVLKENNTNLIDLTLPVFLLRVKNAELVRYIGGGQDLIIYLEPDPEVITTSNQRRTHFAGGNKEWLRKQIRIWEAGTTDQVQIATEETPLEIMCGDIAAVLKLTNGRRYGLTVYRDINPKGWLMQGGTASNMNDIHEPWRLAAREFTEEVLMTNNNGVILQPDFVNKNGSVTFKTAKTAALWGIKPKQAVVCKTRPIHMLSHADRVIIYHENSPWYKRAVYRSTVSPTPIFVDTDINVISAKFPVEIEIPIDSICDLKIYDCEEHWKHNDLPMNRPVRLVDVKTGEMAAIYTCGQNIMTAGYATNLTCQVAKSIMSIA